MDRGMDGRIDGWKKDRKIQQKDDRKKEWFEKLNGEMKSWNKYESSADPSPRPPRLKNKYQTEQRKENPHQVTKKVNE